MVITYLRKLEKVENSESKSVRIRIKPDDRDYERILTKKINELIERHNKDQLDSLQDSFWKWDKKIETHE